MALVDATRPEQCTLVPDADSQLTSDHGFDLRADGERLRPILAQLHSWGVRVSLFMDPDMSKFAWPPPLGADRIELYTGPLPRGVLQQAPNLPTDRALRRRQCRAKALGLG